MHSELNGFQKKNKDLIKYTLIFFAFISLYNFAVVGKCKPWGVDAVTYTYHLPDYSFGFVTKLLPGAIYHLFFKEVYPEQLNIYLTVLMLLLFAFVSFSLAKLITSRKSSQSRKTLFALSLFFLSGPCTFSIYTMGFGMMDFYWLIFSALFLIFVSNKYLKFLIPGIFFLSLLVHISAVFCFIPFFALALLYRVYTSESKNEKRAHLLVFGISIALSVAGVVYFALSEKQNLAYSMSEFHRQIAMRNHLGESAYYVYYDYSFFRHYETYYVSLSELRQNTLIDSGGALAEIINSLYSQLQLIFIIHRHSPYYLYQLLYLLLLISPIYVLMSVFWIKKFKQADKTGKLLFLLIILQFPFTLLSGLCFSHDISRWVSHAFLVEFLLFLFAIYYQKEDFFIEIKAKKLPFWILSGIYYLIYFFTLVKPYQ